MALPTRTSLASFAPLALSVGGVALAACLSPSLAHAANLSVCSSGCSYGSIQAAVDAAADDDVIIVHEDRTQSVSVDRDVKLTIRFDWQHRVSLDAGGADHALYVGPDADVTLWGLDITGASVAGIENHGSARVRNTYVIGNYATYGGILNTGYLVLRDHTLIASNQSTSDFAGGVNNFGGTVQTWSGPVTFMSNVGYNGGALSNHSGDVEIRNSSFSNNQAYLGGAIHNSFGDLYVESSSFSSNYASSTGGGWSNHNIGGTVTMVGVGYAGNSTGSGLYLDCYDVNGPC